MDRGVIVSIAVRALEQIGDRDDLGMLRRPAPPLPANL